MKYRLIALAALVVGCTQPALAQKAKDTLRYPIGSGESALDPYLAPSLFNETWEGSIFDNLLGFNPEKGEFLPLIAKSWSQPNPTTYEYELRTDVKWHDGQPFTADDVVYTLSYLIDPKVNLRYKSNWGWLKSVEKLGPAKVRVIAKYPAPDAMMWMVYGTPMFPAHIHGPLADKLAFGSQPVGTGPYKMVKIDKNTGIVAEKNPYFVATPSKRAASIGRVIAEPIPDVGTLVAKMLTGEADLARNLPIDQTVALRDSGRFDMTLAPPNLAQSFIGFPTSGWQNVKALGDARVRLAIVKAIDRKALINLKYGSVSEGAKPLDGLCFKEQLGCDYTRPVPDYDPAGAKKLLEEAGYKDGFDVTISTFPNAIAEVTAVAGMLRAIGVRASVYQHPPTQRLQLLREGKMEIGYYTWNGGGMFEVSPQNVRFFLGKDYDDPELLKLAEASNATMNGPERNKISAKLYDMANEKAYAFGMLPARAVFAHTKDLKMDKIGMRATEINPHDFMWK
jgi:peptide/nickel transport system substrate-binding protein